MFGCKEPINLSESCFEKPKNFEKTEVVLYDLLRMRK